MKKKTFKKPSMFKKNALLKKVLLSLGTIVLIGVSISAYYLTRYGVGPLAFMAINPVIAPINGDRWYEGTQITVQSTKTTKTASGSVTTVKYTETDPKTNTSVQKTINTAAVVTATGDRQAKTTVTDTNTGAVLVQRTTTDSMAKTYDKDGNPRSTGPLQTTKTTDVRTNPDGTKDTYETTVSYHKDANGNDQKSEVTTKNGEQITQNGVYLPGKEPVQTTTSSGTVVGSYDKPNCDAGMCGTNGSPVCSGAYVFTGGNATSSNKSDGTYGCVQCQGGSLSSEVKDCNQLIAGGASVVLPYDANNQWLSSIKTSGMTGPCFIVRGDTWVQAGIGQVYEGPDEKKKGNVCDGHGGWVPPTTKVNPPVVTTPTVPTTPVVPPTVVKKGVCNGGSMAGLIMDAYAISSGGALGIITGTIDGVRTVINCANAENPSFTFCRSKAGLDANGNCIPDPTEVVQTPIQPVEGENIIVPEYAPQNPPVKSLIQRVVGAGAGGVAGALGCVITGPFYIPCVIGTTVIGSEVGNTVGNIINTEPISNSDSSNK